MVVLWKKYPQSCYDYLSGLVYRPLPNVPELAKYGNTTEGLGSWDEWEQKRKQRGFDDPYDAWQMERQNNPALDEVNAMLAHGLPGNNNQ